MQFFRRLKGSRIGSAIGIGFLALMGFAFAASDLTGTGGMGVFGPSSAQVADVAGESVTANELQTRTQRVFERLRQEQPELTMDRFLAEDGLQRVLDEMIAVKALITYGERHGIRISKKLVDAEIARTPAFADASGNFSETQFRAMLAQQRVSEAELREDFTGQLIRQHLLMAAGAGVRTPEGMVPPYAAMLIEQRTGEMLAIPSEAFAPAQPGTDAELKAYYAAHPAEFSRPEQRKLRYALVTRARFEAQAAPTEAEIAAAYKARAKDYAARTSRDFSQLILPTEAQARDIAAKAAAGKPLGDLAREAGLSAARLTGLDQPALAAQTSADIAKAAFAAEKGKLVGPVRSALGWTLLSVDDIRTVPGKTLDQARAELVPQLRAEKAAQLFADFVNDIDGKLGEGATLAEVAKANELEVVETPLLTVQGRNLADPAYQPDAVVTALLKPGFAIGTGEDPQIAQVRENEEVAILLPADIVAAGPPPFAEVRPAVEAAWRLSQGAAKARAAADKIVAALAKGVSVDEAMKQAGAAGQPRQTLAVRRVDLQQQQGPVPPPLQALFALKAGSARAVPMERNMGYLVVRLDKITAQDPKGNEALMQSTRAGLANVLGGEYAVQLIDAIEKALKVKRNATAIASIEKALREANGEVL